MTDSSSAEFRARKNRQSRLPGLIDRAELAPGFSSTAGTRLWEEGGRREERSRRSITPICGVDETWSRAAAALMWHESIIETFLLAGAYVCAHYLSGRIYVQLTREYDELANRKEGS